MSLLILIYQQNIGIHIATLNEDIVVVFILSVLLFEKMLSSIMAIDFLS